MKLYIFLLLFVQKLFLLPRFIFYAFKDRLYYYINKDWKIFEGWGLHVYVGKFGAGKTSSMVRSAYNIAVKYPQVTILTNLNLKNFPKHTKILPLISAKDILNAPQNTLVLIDEIGTIFNSRDFSKSKESVPKILFQHLCQCRKRRMMIFATSQRWNFVDKQLRDIVATVRSTHLSFAHPFSRMGTVKVYDSVQYDHAFMNPLYPIVPLTAYAYVQTDKLRNLYDTSELVENMLSADYVDDKEILENQGYSFDFSEIGKEAQKAIKSRKNV